ncbi:hypothetical protein CDL15_Pgr024913 [Punica granatum]|uniref:Uncharacterized protein n=1 Tax=Punica granatum TaxID=22663 RepID=A0A218W7W1_PUNGR|nr:hypothetical protein CDL15_Pgr024913 [Punica granatum]
MAPRKPSTDSDPFFLVGSSSSHHATCSSYIPNPLSRGDSSRASSSRNNTVTRRQRGVDGVSKTPHDHASSSSSYSSSASSSSLTDDVDVGLLSQSNPGSLNLGDGGPSSPLAGPTPAPNDKEEERKLRRSGQPRMLIAYYIYINTPSSFDQS